MESGIPEGAAATRTVRLPYDARSARVVRRQVGDDLGSRGISPNVVADVVLVLSELVGNSLRHAAPLAGGELEVTWEMKSDGVELRVTDGGGGPTPEVRAVGVDNVSGRGLTIVARLTAAWGVERTALGTTVWARVNGKNQRNERVRLA